MEVVSMSTMVLTRVLTCAHCGNAREFVQPPCPDGHEGDCPDLMCSDCGLLVVL
jgi:hypothetical protein